MSDEVHGKGLRKHMSRKQQGVFKLQAKRPQVVSMIQESNRDRLPDLIPIRHTRMNASPFTFYRGTAGIMAFDLHHLPHTQLHIQTIGDCHLMNFGGFATPERSLIFDANDFDETYIAPWEWDIKRLTTSFMLAARNNKLKETDAKELAFDCAQAYRQYMLELAQMDMLDLWYMKFDLESMRENAQSQVIKNMISDAIQRAYKNTSKKVFYKITESALGSFEIVDQPPLIFHNIDVDKDKVMIEGFIKNYWKTLQPDRRWLISQFKLIDVALKVVGVGSVGTRCYVALLMNKYNEPLFLQIKEARRSALEPYVSTKMNYKHHGQRVVEGQRLVQAASDIFLGWSTGREERHFYIRQLRDRKVAPNVESFNKELLSAYATLCGRMLARSHAKTGHARILSSYMGKSEVFEDAISNFAVDYADQTEKDYEEFQKAIKAGKLAV